jgi:hypothetical protein
MYELSSAAQAVLDFYYSEKDNGPLGPSFGFQLFTLIGNCTIKDLKDVIFEMRCGIE